MELTGAGTLSLHFLRYLLGPMHVSPILVAWRRNSWVDHEI